MRLQADQYLVASRPASHLALKLIIVTCMIINYSLYDYALSMPARLRNFFYSFFSILSFEECQVCVHYLEITILTPATNIGVLAGIIIEITILIKCLPFGKI